MYSVFSILTKYSFKRTDLVVDSTVTSVDDHLNEIKASMTFFLSYKTKKYYILGKF